MSIYREFQGRTVLVTGGAQGIGEAIVRAFHEAGARVFFCDKATGPGRALAKEIGAPKSFARVDLARENQIVAWIAGLRRRGSIDVLVNNAATDPRCPLAQMTGKQWDALFAANLRACFFTAREAVPAMRAGSAIINLASITFHIAPPAMTAYVATKGGIIAFTRSLAREVGPRGIRVNTVSPGWVMTQRQLREFVTPSVKKLIRRSQCIPELIQPEEIAEVVMFLASDASRAVTGQEILVDRGWAHS